MYKFNGESQQNVNKRSSLKEGDYALLICGIQFITKLYPYNFYKTTTFIKSSSFRWMLLVPHRCAMSMGYSRFQPFCSSSPTPSLGSTTRQAQPLIFTTENWQKNIVFRFFGYLKYFLFTVLVESKVRFESIFPQTESVNSICKVRFHLLPKG